MSPVDPLRLRRIAKRYPDDHDIASAWKEVERDVWDIARIPSTSPEITRLSKILGIIETGVDVCRFDSFHEFTS